MSMILTDRHVCIKLTLTNDSLFRKELKHKIASILKEFRSQGTVTVTLYFSEVTHSYYVAFEFLIPRFAEIQHGKEKCLRLIRDIGYISSIHQLPRSEDLPPDAKNEPL